MATQTPWGKSQDKTKITRGINFYSCAGHGGYKVSKKLNESMPEALRNDDGWYEEDCEWSCVVVAFPQHFDEYKYKAAIATMKQWLWKRYEAHFGVELKAGESSLKDEQLFREANKDKFQAVAAYGDWHEKVPHGMVGVCAQRGYETKTLLVPKEEYDKRHETYGIFVVEKEYTPVSI